MLSQILTYFYGTTFISRYYIMCTIGIPSLLLVYWEEAAKALKAYFIFWYWTKLFIPRMAGRVVSTWFMKHNISSAYKAFWYITRKHDPNSFFRLLYDADNFHSSVETEILFFKSDLACFNMSSDHWPCDRREDGHTGIHERFPIQYKYGFSTSCFFKKVQITHHTVPYSAREMCLNYRRLL